MILRNPSRPRDFFFLACSYILVLISNPVSGQGIIGHVREYYSRLPVEGAMISVIQGDSVITSFKTDSSGAFTYYTAQAQRIRLSVASDGYSPSISQDWLLDGYSTFRSEINLMRSSYPLKEMTVMALAFRPFPYAHHITKDDLNTIARNFDDPVRIAHSKPGIVLLNDQANHFSSRGQSPVFNNWYLEGLPIVNPNHTNNAGILDDRPTQFGGGVNMFSAQVLTATDVYTGLNPFTIRRTGGAAINMNLYESAKPELRAKAGLLGFEFGGGLAPVPESILDFNLRYSFTGLLSGLGVDFGGEKIGFYDGVISYLKQSRKHKLKFFGWAGRSTNEFDRVELAEERERYKDFFNIDYGNTVLGAGARYDVTMSPSVFLKSGFSYSSNTSTYAVNGQFGPNPSMVDLDHRLSILSSFLDFTFHHSESVRTMAGIHYFQRNYREDAYPFLPFPEETFLRPFIQTSVIFAHRFMLEAGGELYWSVPFEKLIPGYRTSLRWYLTEKNAVLLGFNHGAGEPLVPSAGRAGHSLSDNFEAGWEHSGKTQSIGLNLYYQRLRSLLAFYGPEPSLFIADYPYPNLGPGGLGSFLNAFSKNIGIEGMWRFNNARGWRFEVNQSIYKSRRAPEDGMLSSGRYDGRFTSNVSVGKEVFNKKKDKNRLWNFSMRGLLHGGLLEPRIDMERSALQETTVFVYPGLFEERLPVFKRIDLSISRIIATSNIRWRYALDVQNVFGLMNIAYHFYDPFLQRVETQEQLSIIPVLSVQASW